MTRKRPVVRPRKPQARESAAAVVQMPQTFDEALAALEPRQRHFVREYLIDRNGAAAYVRCGYRAKTPQVAAAHSSRLVAKGNIALAIRLGTAALDAALQSDAETAVRENLALATSRLSDIMAWGEDDGGRPFATVKGSGEITDRAMAAVKSVKIKRTLRPDSSGTATHLIDEHLEVTLHDKGAALERVLRMTGRLKADSAGPAVAVQIIVEGTPGLIRAEVEE
jgi:phage terminase small subunit